MDSDQGKLFIGGISWETTEEKLREHFENYGEVSHTVVMRDKETNRPRGFGFICFADPSVLDRVLQDSHNIDGRTVEAKRALSREEQQVTRSSNPNASRGYGGGGSVRTKKIFVGGLPATLTEEEFREYFETYGHVTDVVVMYDQNTQRPRGFGFISFDSEDAVDRVLHKSFHDLIGKQVEVKRALPKDANMGGSGHSMGGNAGSGGYNQTAYGGQMDSGRFMQSQDAVGGFPPYGSSGFSASGYGYGTFSNGMVYGAYGAFGGVNPGYGGPAAAAGYGNPGVPSSGYSGGLPGAPRNTWGIQAAAGYSALGYGNASSWGSPSPAGTPGSGGPGSEPRGQSPNGAFMYGIPGYGYGGYGGGDAGAYGVVGGRSGSVPCSNAGGPGMQGSGGYIGSSNPDAGYGNAGWRSDPSKAAGNHVAQAPDPQGGSGYGDAPI